MALPTYLISALLLLAGAFLVFRVVVRRDYRKHGRLRPLSSFLELLIFCLWAAFAYVYRPGDWPTTHVGPILGGVGWALFAGGMVIAFAVMAAFGLSRAFGLESNELKQTGAYGLSRNPQTVAFRSRWSGTSFCGRPGRTWERWSCSPSRCTS